MDLFDKLILGHRIAEQQFAEIERTTGEEARRREQLFSELRAGLETHETFEEEVLYPEIEQFPATKLLVAKALDDHVEFEGILQEIAETAADKDDWVFRIHELRALVQEHIAMEEDRMFPIARAALSENRTAELGRQIEGTTE